VRLEVLVREDQLTEAVDAIREAAATGEVGDGKIIVLQAADVVRIRTNERGETALS
jgi:nitrogen regulatory protein PII